MRVRVPYAGVFCAFSSPEVEDIARVRLHVFTLPVVPADRPTTVRVHLCPELPDQIDEMTISEESEWGASVTAGASEVLQLYQGARLELSMQGHAKVLTWHGARVHTAFTYVPPPREGAAARPVTLPEVRRPAGFRLLH